MALHDLALLGVELARLEEDAVGDADLADVVQRARVAQQLGVRDAQPIWRREALAQEAHPLDVRAGVAVARLGRLGEAADDLELRLAQLLGALPDAALEDLAVERHPAALGFASYREVLARGVRERTEELRETQLEVVRRLAQAAESRDGDTGARHVFLSLLCERARALS